MYDRTNDKTDGQVKGSTYSLMLFQTEQTNHCKISMEGQQDQNIVLKNHTHENVPLV